MRKIFASLPYLLLFSLLAVTAVHAEDRYFPYVLASQEAATVADKADAVKQALMAGGFEIAGEYAPYAGAHILVVTSADLKKAATASDFGGYGAGVRVALTQVSDQVQIAYTNPFYMQHIYRMKEDLSGVAAALEKALGKQKDFGMQEGLTARKLSEYHYMFGMPYFDDHIELLAYADHQSALDKVESGLADSEAVSKVYRIDIPGKQESVFGVAIIEGKGADKTVMAATDTGDLRHTPHLPYELLVSGNKAYILHGKFRIAQSFPDLGMGTFMKISGAPNAIEETIKEAIQ
ncbi:hypothetical protein Pcar_0283 [Syntrophotalea carbinolica DSM 2380]|uniref:Uncharacterized protein n=1 Tax=Syntrophotalea carbinolica (strain DSM 2380 / NBRC 103641 / GraBd1) TaxID=338963 RepID=Q3A7V0_SYNC1|nr:hypothetical protein [Syntrophotalea carbinolica]ABA87544.1 hypothetical protein Pcar_0283 [Syntrophotalea carbinolica DSM 2380]